MISIDDILAAAPSSVRDTLDDGTKSFLAAAVDGKSESDAKRAVAPYLGLKKGELDVLFAKLSVDDGPSTSGASMFSGSTLLASNLANGSSSRPESPSKAGKKARAQPEKPTVNAYSQQSRFHTATLTTLSKEVDLRNVNLTIGDADLLVDARLWLKAGTHYGLIGRNGTGKSTLLGVIGDHSLVGFPENVRTLYVAQLDVVDAGGSVLDAVLAADAEREVRMRDVRALEAATVSGTPDELNGALEGYIQRVAGERIEAAQKIATLRSGKRGKIARGAALKAENTMRETVRGEVYAGSELEAEVAARVLSDLYAELDKMDAHSADARARSILAGLGVTDDMADGPISALSGGWRMRVAIAKAMFVEPDILLLDECTNHLDLAAIAWLQEYLVTLEITILCVSHDRDFLNGVSEEIIRLKDKTLSYHPGNYDAFEQAQDELRKKKERQHAALERRREHVNKSIEKMQKHANKAQDDKVLGQVASRQKKLERMAGIDKTESGKRFKVSYWAGYHSTLRPELELIKGEKDVDLKIPNPDPIRGNAPVVALHSVSFNYPGKKRRVLKSISLSIYHGDHLALVGLNGCGKSTLVQLLSGALKPSHGRVEVSPRLRIAHYTQHFVDELSSIAASPMALLHQRAHVDFNADTGAAPPKENDLRKWLGSFELAGSLATRPVHTLSGGQRARLAMALMLYDRPHMLLLDEITNHLDMYAVQGLVAALNEYDGTVVLVTHDRHFVREVADDVYALVDGRLTLLEEGVDEYVESLDLEL